MQFLIDTDTDKPAILYKIGKFLTDTYAVTETEPMPGVPTAPPPPPPDYVSVPSARLQAFNAQLSDACAAALDDPEVEIDEPTPSLTVEVALPPPVPAPPGPSVPAELDSRGYPWDGRIHASNRARKLDGSWKNKRGVDANLIVAVEAQNKPGNALATATTGAINAALSAGTVTVPETAPTASAVVNSVAPPPPPPTVVAPAPVAPPPPAPTLGNVAPAAAAPSVIDFRGLMVKIQTATSSGKLTTEQVNGALASVGLKPEDMAALISNALLVASVNAAIDACLT